MFSSIPALRDELKARLAPLVPADWKIVSDLDDKPTGNVANLLIEFVGLDTSFNGSPLPAGILAAKVNLIITDPRTNKDGEAGAEKLLVDLIIAIDPSTDIAWTTADKQKLEPAGTWSWAMQPITAFVAITTPAVEPATQED
ncbi:hypothetical protein [Microbacterium sp. NPDC057650]|uniref:hypothetical protein n=1 Tax=unclassified Microbacterium TaxID=2609290 RepID=UPI0036731353